MKINLSLNVQFSESKFSMSFAFMASGVLLPMITELLKNLW